MHASSCTCMVYTITAAYFKWSRSSKGSIQYTSNECARQHSMGERKRKRPSSHVQLYVTIQCSCGIRTYTVHAEAHAVICYIDLYRNVQYATLHTGGGEKQRALLCTSAKSFQNQRNKKKRGSSIVIRRRQELCFTAKSLRLYKTYYNTQTRTLQLAKSLR